MSLKNVMSRLGMFRSGSNSFRMMSTDVSPETRLEKSLNQVSLLGRVGMDPQKRGSDSNPAVIFSLATNSGYPGSGEKAQRTDWHRICVFKPHLRDTVYDFVRKGQRVLINGRVSYGKITDESGKEQTTTAIVADDVIMFAS